MTTTAELTKDAYNTAVDAAVSTVRAEHPDLDLRSGTAVRALVIEPGALLDASQRDIVNRLRTAMSLKAMSRETTVPRDDADAVLSNFGISLGGGTKATGLVRVDLTGTSPVTVRAGVEFKTEDSVKFVVTKTTVASVDPADGEEEIRPANGGRYYFTIPVEAVEVGSSGNISQGRSLSCSIIIGNYYSSEAFADFTGGEDGESVASAVARIPSALAYRGMTNALSVRAQLSAVLADPSVLHAVSCVGHRDRAQLRDKHNPLGVAIGGRVDVYARLFDLPGVESFVVDGTLISADERAGEGVYSVKLPSYPGFYAVRSVGKAEEPGNQGSFQYTLVRGAVDGASEDHDFDVSPGDSESVCETAWSAYQTGRLLVYADWNSAYGNSRSFKVDLYWTDGIKELQELVDAPETRNTAADYVVRSPAICLVSMTAPVRLRAGSSATAADLEKAVMDYVNGRSFTDRLTRSELANVLIQHGVESVDLGDGGMKLSGRICGADGVWYYLDGDSLDVSAVGPESAMLSSGTVVFAAEQGAIQVITGAGSVQAAA